MDGVQGLKALGVRDLNYKMVSIAQYSQPVSNRFNSRHINQDEDAEDINRLFSTAEL